MEAMPAHRPSDSASSVTLGMEAAHLLEETSYRRIESTMHYIEQARERAERAVKELRTMGAEQHLVEATERTEAELSDLARRYRHGSYFAVPRNQTSL